MTVELGDNVVTTYFEGEFVLQSYVDDGEHRFACLIRPVVAKRLRAGEQPRHSDRWLAPPSTVARKDPA